MKTAYKFLQLLQENNNREWFHEHKQLYKQAREQFTNFVQLLILHISEFDRRIIHLRPEATVFRINRDIRFTRDKSPYKLNFGAAIAQGGRRGSYAGYYFHLQPGNSFLGGGVYCPGKEVLDAIRTEIYNNPREFIAIIEDKQFKQTFGSLQGRKLKKSPRGFDSSFQHIDLVKYKDYIVSTPIDDKTILSDKLLDYTVEIFRILHPFNEFINKAVDKLRG